MTHTAKTILASTTIAFATSLTAVAKTTAGTPITVENLVDHAEMIRLADAIDAAVAKAIADGLRTGDIATGAEGETKVGTFEMGQAILDRL